MHNVFGNIGELNEFVDEQQKIYSDFKVISIQLVNPMDTEFSNFFILFYYITKLK